MLKFEHIEKGADKTSVMELGEAVHHVHALINRFEVISYRLSERQIEIRVGGHGQLNNFRETFKIALCGTQDLAVLRWVIENAAAVRGDRVQRHLRSLGI